VLHGFFSSFEVNYDVLWFSRQLYSPSVRMSTLSRIINKYSCNVRLDILHHNSAILIVLFPVFSNGALCPRLRRHNFPDNLGKKINMYDKLFKVVHRGRVK
jgi:hypothetical protein